MNHKRGKPKKSRAGCLLCKPHKAGGNDEKAISKTGFSKLRKIYHARKDLEDYDL